MLYVKNTCLDGDETWYEYPFDEELCADIGYRGDSPDLSRHGQKYEKNTIFRETWGSFCMQTSREPEELRKICLDILKNSTKKFCRIYGHLDNLGVNLLRYFLKTSFHFRRLGEASYL